MRNTLNEFASGRNIFSALWKYVLPLSKMRFFAVLQSAPCSYHNIKPHNEVTMTIPAVSALAWLFSLLVASAFSFSPEYAHRRNGRSAVPRKLLTHEKLQTSLPSPSTSLNLFDKMFEEEGDLGKGITVGKLQIALDCTNRDSTSIFALLEDAANDGGSEPHELARMANDVCLSLLRKSDEWSGACSDSKWFKWDDAGKAESLYNDWANREAAKFERDYVPSDTESDDGGPTTVVVSILVEIQGDTTKFDGAGFSIAGTKEVLSSIASDVLVADGECVNAVEVFWTPSDKDEVLTRQDLIMDFPELIDL